MTGPVTSGGELDQALAALRLVDHHCHGVLTTDLDPAGFDALISEGGAPPEGTNFDTPAGLAIRRHCAPVLGLLPHAHPSDYLARRTELGHEEVTRRFLAGSGTGWFCVDTGFTPQGLTTPGELAAAARGQAREVVRLESVAEQVVADGVEPGEFAAAFATALEFALRERRAVGVKSIAAYRTGLAVDPRVPGHAEVSVAVARWQERDGLDGQTGRWRLDDPVLERVLLQVAVDAGLPIQFHVGFGDSDIRMHRADPSLLTDWLHTHRVPVMLLHCWPFHRQAAFLAVVHPHVHLDVGLTLHHVGPGRATAVLAEAMELVPFGKLLYSSDAYGVPEFYHLGALAFRTALGRVLGERVNEGEWSMADALRIARMIGARNAARVYGLDIGSPGTTAQGRDGGNRRRG